MVFHSSPGVHLLLRMLGKLAVQAMRILSVPDRVARRGIASFLCPCLLLASLEPRRELLCSEVRDELQYHHEYPVAL